MQTDDTPSPVRGKHPAKSCLLLFMTAILVCFLLAMSGIACIITLDTINLRGENHTLSWRVERYKVACLFIWFDFKDLVSRTFSKQSPSEPGSVQSPANPPELESEPETEPQTP